MPHRAVYARICLVVFLLGLVVAAIGLYAGNGAVTGNAAILILLAGIATYVLRKDFQKELDAIDAEREQAREAQAKADAGAPADESPAGDESSGKSKQDDAE